MLSGKAAKRRSTDLKGDEKEEAKKNNEAARLWISGLETVKRKLGLESGHRPLGHALLPSRLRLCRRYFVPMDHERLFPNGRDRVWHREVAPRSHCRQYSRWRDADVTVTSGSTSAQRCRRRVEVKRDDSGSLDLPPQLQTALQALYGHYEKTFDLWEDAKITCLLASSLFVTTQRRQSSFTITSQVFPTMNEDGTSKLVNGRLAYFETMMSHWESLSSSADTPNRQ